MCNTLVTFEFDYRKNRHVYICRIGVRCAVLICRGTVYIFVVFFVYIWGIAVHIFAVYLFVGLSYICLWYFPYIIYIWTIATRRIQVYIFVVFSVFIFVELLYTYWSFFRRYICRVAVILDALPIYWLYCRRYLFL